MQVFSNGSVRVYMLFLYVVGNFCLSDLSSFKGNGVLEVVCPCVYVYLCVCTMWVQDDSSRLCVAVQRGRVQLELLSPLILGCM